VKFEEMVDAYNSESVQIEQLVQDLLEQSRSLSEEAALRMLGTGVVFGVAGARGSASRRPR
jgi:hypothetical protein